MELEVRYLEWLDSMGGAGWKDLKGILEDQSVCRIQTVGFVIQETEAYVCILQSLDHQAGDAKQADNYIRIPKITITRSETLGSYGPRPS